jgi:hypothetical protein
MLFHAIQNEPKMKEEIATDHQQIQKHRTKEFWHRVLLAPGKTVNLIARE